MCVFSLDLCCLYLRCIACIHICEVLKAKWYQKNVVPWIVYVFGPLVRITDGFLLPVEHFNFRVVEFRSVKMLSNSRIRDVFQIRAGES